MAEVLAFTNELIREMVSFNAEEAVLMWLQLLHAIYHVKDVAAFGEEQTETAYTIAADMLTA